MKKLADAIVAGALSVAYGLIFISLIARVLDHGGWWILAGALALLTNHALMRYQFARSKATSVSMISKSAGEFGG